MDQNACAAHVRTERSHSLSEPKPSRSKSFLHHDASKSYQTPNERPLGSSTVLVLDSKIEIYLPFYLLSHFY